MNTAKRTTTKLFRKLAKGPLAIVPKAHMQTMSRPQHMIFMHTVSIILSNLKTSDLTLHPDKEVPARIAYDYTSPGRLWDPTLSAYWYTFSTSTKKFTPARENTPVNYLYFSGRWGDKEYGDDVEGQESFHGFHKWGSGPQGPLFKHLDRSDVCLPNGPKCEILDRIS
jgi:hypothetical protein